MKGHLLMSSKEKQRPRHGGSAKRGVWLCIRGPYGDPGGITEAGVVVSSGSPQL